MRRLFSWWFHSEKRAKFLGYLCCLQALALVLFFSYLANLLSYPYHWTAEALSSGGWCTVVGKEIEVEVERLYLDDWCCTVNGDTMTFLNTGVFVFGKKESYTRFGGVSFITGMYDALKQYDGKSVVIRGRLGSYQNSPQIIIDSTDQVEALP